MENEISIGLVAWWVIMGLILWWGYNYIKSFMR